VLATAAAVRTDGTRTTRGATTACLATRVLVLTLLALLLLVVVVATTGAAAPAAAVAQQGAAERPRRTAQVLSELGMARRKIVQVRANAVAARTLENVGVVVEREPLRGQTKI